MFDEEYKNLQVQQTISLVFGTFLEMRSCRKVVRHMHAHGLLLPRRPLGEPQTSFRPPTVSALTAMLLPTPALANVPVASVLSRITSSPETTPTSASSVVLSMASVEPS